MSNQQKVVEPESATKAKQMFAEYFETTGKRDIKQFYYDWHSLAMIEPFAELTSYFMKKYPENTAEHFDQFVAEYIKSVET